MEETKQGPAETHQDQDGISATQDIKQEDTNSAGSKSSRSSPSPPSSSAQSSNGIRQHPPPIITNSVPHNRPPSTTSVHSNGSAGPRSTTATSRRGGRTRSRSPPMMVQRPNSRGPSTSEQYSSLDDRGAPPSPANPSAAAAAAAAVAKSITRNPPPPSSWYDAPEARDRDYRRARGSESSRYHPRYFEGAPPHGHPGPPQHRHSNWPEEEGGPQRSRYPPPHRPPREEHYGYREGAYSYRGRSRVEPYPPPYEEEYDRRYVENRYDERPPRSTSPRPGYDYRGGRERRLHPPRDDPYYQQHPPPQHGSELDGGRADVGGPSSMKRTTRVIGTATPIHMPRAPDPATRSSRGSVPPSSSGSIFRGRPGGEMRNPPHLGQEEDNPQKILMALRTPSTSFEEKPKNGSKRRSGDPLSPEAPPQIQHSHHQNSADSNLFFEPQRSPKGAAGPPQPTSSIDMAPSFTLFNQSFDSIGDTANFFNVSGPLDSALQSTSFGAGPTASEDKGNDIQLSSSAGNFSQQLLGGSGSGALTFEMSPSNSFGNGPPALRSGNMMVLGGQDHRSASPSQVLDMYRSYSGGGPSPRSNKGGAMEENQIRINGGSLSGPSLSNAYSRSFTEQPHPNPYRSSHPESSDGAVNFYVFLKKHKDAFRECTFLLPGLKAVLSQESNVKNEESAETPKRHTRHGDPYGEPNPQDIAIALRRVASAVCAFGGTFLGDRATQQTTPNNTQSIFREKPGGAATVTPNASTSATTGSRRSRQRAKYDEMLPSRYYENDNRLSWEFEENPPIDDIGKDEEEADDMNNDEADDDKSKGADGKQGDRDASNGLSEDKKASGTGSKDGDQPKMRYRCKLCGQPKQNHTCPYQQSLARSIGTMAYPAVNAFTSAEPGLLAPALSEMNNFVISGCDSVSSAETSPSRPTPDRMRRLNQGMPSGSAQVTPESFRGTPRSGTSPVTTPQRSRTPTSSRRSQRRVMGGLTPSGMVGSYKKRNYGQMIGGGPNPDDQGDLLFVEAADLRPEQFRIVTSSTIVNSPEAFTYPALPLPYAQRKRLSDNLFSLSKEVPQLTDECAPVLREAREKDLWDLAVAELMTQVVVVVHCHDGDSRFEGLRRYLLTLGISC